MPSPPPSTPVDAHVEASTVFTRLAPFVAARASMRLWQPDLRRYADRARPLTRALPAVPAAVPLYLRGRTRLLVLDFDPTGHDTDTVDTDTALAVEWIRRCGGRAIGDRSTRGGRHLLVPLPVGVAVTRGELEPVLRLLAARLPTLDITPCLNDRTGAITPPGSRCKEGGYRRLDGPLSAALDALTIRSAPGFLPRLAEFLGGGRTAVAQLAGSPAGAHPDADRAPVARLWDGHGDDARLRAPWRLSTPLPAAVTAFAVHGQLPADRRWHTAAGRPDKSAARQSVLAAAALRGHSLADIHANLPGNGGAWRGLADAYARYGRAAGTALRRDWDTACRWTSRHAPEFLPGAHKTQQHTGGTRPGTRQQPEPCSPHHLWLAAATVWADHHWPGSPRRATVHAVLQALAHAAAVAGHLAAGGTPVVEVGGRSLSLWAGLMSETTVWQTLRDLREIPGSPILLTRRGAGHLADRYALTTPTRCRRPIRPDPAQTARVQVAAVHDAWSVLGLRCRRLYELVVLHGLCTPADVFAAAHLSPSAGYNALAVLRTAGLITHTHAHLAPGPVELDHIATAHGLPQRRTDTITRHRRQRLAWHAWLATHTTEHHRPPTDPPEPATPAHGLTEPWTPDDTADYLAAVLATGPPIGTFIAAAYERRSLAVASHWPQINGAASNQDTRPRHPRPPAAPRHRRGHRWRVLPHET